MSIAPLLATRRGSLPFVRLWFVVLLAGCAHHVRLSSPGTSPGALYVCSATQCRPADVDVPAELNQTGTQHVVLPTECKGLIHQIVVLNADSSAPETYVTCAPPEEGIGEMGPSEPAPAPGDS